MKNRKWVIEIKDVELSANEFLYIVSLFDIDKVYGIRDGFYGMDESEIRAEIQNVKRNLYAKGYAEMDFDGNFAIKEEVKNLLEVCVRPERYLSFDRVKRFDNSVIRLYIQGNRLVKVVGQNKNYKVGISETESILKDISDFILWIKKSLLPKEEEVFVESKALKNIKKRIGLENAEAELIHIGCSPLKANILCQGLSGEAYYYAMLMINFTEDAQAVCGLAFIDSAQGVLQLKADERVDKETVQISTVSCEDIMRQIKECVNKHILGKQEKKI